MMEKSKSKRNRLLVPWRTSESCIEVEVSNNRFYALRWNRKVVNKVAKLEWDRETYLRDGVKTEVR